MEQFYDPPSSNSRQDIHELFPHKRAQSHNPQSPDFVPFNQERDKLGRLLSRQQQHRNVERRHSLKSPAQSNSERRIAQITERGRSTDKAVEHIFKVRSISNIQSSKENVKLRIAPGSNKLTWSPSIGQYNYAEIADKIKYNKSKKAQIKVKHEEPKIQLKYHQQTELKPSNSLKRMLLEEKPKLLPSQQLRPNPNLPQLEKFHTMRKLQMVISPNFERDHLKFKSLMRDSLVLANKIKRDLELDDYHH